MTITPKDAPIYLGRDRVDGEPRYIVFGWIEYEGDSVQFTHRFSLATEAIEVARSYYFSRHTFVLSVTEYDRSTGVGTSVFHVVSHDEPGSLLASNATGVFAAPITDTTPTERTHTS